MSVLSREALEGSPLADLHAVASELGVDGFRRMRKADLVEAILARQGGGDGAAPPAVEPAPAAADDAPEAADGGARGRSRRGGRSRSRSRDEDGAEERAPRRREGGRREAPEGGRRDAAEGEERAVTGVMEVLGNGSGFVRVNPPGASDEDVYVSAAQVRRCELVSGDTVTGPARAPRRSERYPSLVRVETINGAPADEVSAGTPFDQLAAAFPTEPVTFTAKDPALKQIADLAPFGRGSRVSVTGAGGSGRTTVLRALAIELAAQEDVEVAVVLAGVRPEETAEWAAAELEPAAVSGLATGAEAQAQAIERVVEAGRRTAARGGNAAVVIDALDALAPGVARRLLAAARNVPDGGSLTIVAAAREPVGGETTTIALDARAGALERRPVLDPVASVTLRLEALVGSRKAATIAKNRAKAADAGS
jgi:transcription termination factor Rho